MTQAKIAYGAAFAIGDGETPEVFTDVGEVTSITPPAGTRDTPDATNMSSPDYNKEFIAGLNDPGETTVEFNFIPGGASDLALQAAWASRTAGNYRITFPDDAAVWDFTGLLTKFAVGALTPDGKMMASATWKVSGSVIKS